MKAVGVRAINLGDIWIKIIVIVIKLDEINYKCVWGRVPRIEPWDTSVFRGQTYTVKQQRELIRSNQRYNQKNRNSISWKLNEEIISRRKKWSTMSLIV